MYLYSSTIGSSASRQRSEDDIRTDKYISRTIGRELITSLLSRAALKDNISSKLQIKGPKQAETVHKNEITVLRKQLDAFPEGLRENARVNFLLVQNNKRKDLQEFQCTMIGKLVNILRSVLTDQNIDFRNFHIGGYDKGTYEIFFRIAPQKNMTKALFVTALRISFGDTMLKSNQLIDKLFDSFDFSRSDQMDWRSFLFLFTIMMQPYNSFIVHLRLGYALYSSLGSLDLDCTESVSLGSLKNLITSPVLLALHSAVKADFDAAWFYLSINDTESIKLASRAKSSMSSDPDSVKVPYHIFQKLLATEPFSKYKRCCTTFGKRDKRQWTSHLEENFYHPIILKKLKELRREFRNDAEAEKYVRLSNRRMKTNSVNIWKLFVRKRNALRLIMISFEMRSTIGNTSNFFNLWRSVTIFLSAVQKVQRVIRGFIARRRRNLVSKLRRTVLKIQSGTRQMIMKLKYRKKYYKFYWAAVTIQRHLRGRNARTRVATMVEEYYDTEKRKLIKEKAAWQLQREIKAIVAIQMAIRKAIRRRRTMKKLAEKARVEEAKKEMDRIVAQGRLAKSVHRLQLSDWYKARKEEHDKDRMDESQTALQRKAILDRRNQNKREERKKQEVLREAQIEKLEEEKVERWLQNWEVQIEQRGIARRKKCQNIIALPENQTEVLLKKQLVKRINVQMKEVLRKADKMKIPMELPEAKEIATREIIEEEVKQELIAARAEMKAEALAIQHAEELKAEAKKQQEMNDRKRKRKWAVVIIQSCARVYLARKEARKRAYLRYERHFDPKLHLYFYMDKKTNKYFWDKPKILGSYDVPMRDSWIVMHDSEGDQYFYNVMTWKQTWEMPIGCLLCEKCHDDFAVAKLSFDRTCYCDKCLYDMAQQLIGMEYDTTKILFKPFAGNETTAVITNFRLIPETTWYLHTLKMGVDSHLKHTAEEEEEMEMRMQNKKAAKKKKEKKKKKKKDKSFLCEMCSSTEATMLCDTCEGKVFCGQCFSNSHSGSNMHETKPLTAVTGLSNALVLPDIDERRPSRRSRTTTPIDGEKKKKKKKKSRGDDSTSSKSPLRGANTSQSEGEASNGTKDKKKKRKKKKKASATSETDDSMF